MGGKWAVSLLSVKAALKMYFAFGDWHYHDLIFKMKELFESLQPRNHLLLYDQQMQFNQSYQHQLVLDVSAL